MFNYLDLLGIPRLYIAIHSYSFLNKLKIKTKSIHPSIFPYIQKQNENWKFL